MARKKISELPTANPLATSDSIPIIQGGVSKRTNMQAIMNAVASATIKGDTGLTGATGATGPQGPIGVAPVNMVTLEGTQSLINKSVNKFTFVSPANSAILLTRSDNLTHALPIVSGNLAVEQLVQSTRSINYVTVLGDAGTFILHPASDPTGRTFTISSNASVPYVIGTAITFINQAGSGLLNIAIATDTMRLVGAGTTGSRTLAAAGIATAMKITATEWIISGVGLT